MFTESGIRGGNTGSSMAVVGGRSEVVWCFHGVTGGEVRVVRCDLFCVRRR